MKRKIIIHLLLFIGLVFITACSGNDAKSDMDYSTESNINESESGFSASYSDMETSEEFGASEESERADVEIETNRMIIHQANISANVKNLNQSQLDFEKKVTKYGGYIVQSSIYKEDDDNTSGYLVVRIPEQHFQTFLTETEEMTDILERSVTGQDVTEQYVDLESRLTSKRAVEKRLLEFMEDAKKTEDLLQISNDLAIVQEDIERIVGKMNYLENQTSYSTIEIYMYEKAVNIPSVDNKNLDTWEKTKKQLINSVNFILSAISALIIFFIGNLPIIIILALIGFGIYLILKKASKNWNNS